MSDNKRILYSCQGVGISAVGDTSYTDENLVHGAQSVGMTTNFNLEQAFELGQIEIYENIEGTPDLEVTLEKVLDGYPLIYHMATTGVTGTTASGLVARSKQQCDLRLGIFDEAQNNIGDSNLAAEVEVYCSGMYVSSVSYTIPVEGNSTESVTLIGNNKTWLTSNQRLTASAVNAFNGSDSPLALGVPGAASGGIQRREDVMIADCIFPTSIRGVVGSGIGNGWDSSVGRPRIHVQNVSISTDFSREDVAELGAKTPYYRPAGFPIEVTCEIEAITTSGDFINALETGDPTLFGTTASGNNTSEENIFIKLRAGIGFDLGTKNRLSSVTYGGGDAGGGNASCTYSYSNFNSLDVQHVSHNKVGWRANAV